MNNWTAIIYKYVVNIEDWLNKFKSNITTPIHLFFENNNISINFIVNCIIVDFEYFDFVSYFIQHKVSFVTAMVHVRVGRIYLLKMYLEILFIPIGIL